MARKRTDSYWARRSAERLTLAEQEMEPYLQQVNRAYEDAKREVINDLRRMYAAYHREDKGFNMIALNSIVPKGDIKRFCDEMKRRGLNTKLPDNYGGRITRLELIESQIQAKIDRIGQKVVRIESESHRNTVESSFYHSIYDISKGLGATPAFTQLNEKTINKILETKYEGKNYSERVWGNTNVLAQQLREKLAKAIATGQSLEKTTREFRERFGVGESYAKRLIRTETNYFENTAEIESYEAMGIEYFVFVATLDDRTSEICQSMDGKKFKVKDAVAGDNYPPLHPNCRSTIRAYIGKDYEPETRIYRDPETGKNKYIYNMNYETWAKTLIKNTLNDKPAFRYTGNIIGGREHLRKVINKYENDGGLIPKRIARVLEGEQDEALLVTLSEDTAKLFNTVEELGNKVKSGMQVVIDVDHVKHLDNSGHLTGKPYRKNHAKDAKPLTAADFRAIPSIIRNPDLITYAGVGRYGLKIKLEKVTAQRQRAILELVEKDGRLILTSFYNISKRNKKRP